MELTTLVRDFVQKYKVIHILADAKVQKEFIDIYYTLTGRVISCSGCSGSVTPAYNELRRLSNQPGELKPYQKPQMEYTLKPKTRIYVRCLQLVLTPANCTDNNARAMLGENPDNIKCFDVYPLDWKSQSKAFYDKVWGAKGLATATPVTPPKNDAIRVTGTPDVGKLPEPVSEVKLNHAPEPKKKKTGIASVPKKKGKKTKQ